MNQMETRRMCPHCRAFITTKDRVCPYCNGEVGARAVDRRDPAPILGGLIPHAQFLTAVILTINIGVYIASSLNSGLVEAGAKYGPYIRIGEWWRLVTAGFLHGGLLHIGMNSWALFSVGADVEQAYGAPRMCVIYFLSSVCGFYLSMVRDPLAPSVGASAAIMGLIGAMIAVTLHHRGSLASAMRGQYIFWVVYILIIGFSSSSLGGGGLRIDNNAHIGGLVAGFGVGYLAGEPRLGGSLQERIWRVAAYLCVLVTALSFFRMYQWLSRAA